MILFLYWAELLTGNIEAANAGDKFSGIPDIGLLAPIDWSSYALAVGTTEGDFENWFPGVFSDYSWTRRIRQVHSAGLFRVD